MPFVEEHQTGNNKVSYTVSVYGSHQVSVGGYKYNKMCFMWQSLATNSLCKWCEWFYDSGAENPDNWI